MDYGHEQCPSWLQNVKHFFGPKRGLKTLDLVVLRVILACSASCNSLTAEQASESIRLAIEICDIVEPGQRECWIAANSTKITKLCEKVTRSGIERGVQILVRPSLAIFGPSLIFQGRNLPGFPSSSFGFASWHPRNGSPMAPRRRQCSHTRSFAIDIHSPAGGGKYREW